MADVSVLTTMALRDRALHRVLTTVGSSTQATDTTWVTRGQSAVAVRASPSAADMPAALLGAVTALLGKGPRTHLRCSYQTSDSQGGWSLVVDIAVAVARRVPIAVLADSAGAVYLVHPRKGLVAPPPPRTTVSPFEELMRGFYRPGG